MTQLHHEFPEKSHKFKEQKTMIMKNFKIKCEFLHTLERGGLERGKSQWQTWLCQMKFISISDIVHTYKKSSHNDSDTVIC